MSARPGLPNRPTEPQAWQNAEVLPSRDPHGLDLPIPEWQLVKASVPIACADIVVTREDHDLLQVALIRRLYRDGSMRWCHLGGRVGIDEELRAAAIRHLTSTLTVPPQERELLGLSFPRIPVASFEFFRNEELGYSGSGLDPDKHAISWCYHFEWPWSCGPQPAPGGEAQEVQWFEMSRLPGDLWPGTAELVRRCTTPRHLAETYSVISAQADMHNSLMWQTPVLAMTAQAFLLTIGLGPGVAPLARLGAAGLSLVVSILSVQLMLKHSAMQLRDSIALEGIERMRGMMVHHVSPKLRSKGLKGWLVQQRSREWWLFGMGAFGVVSLAVALASIAQIVAG